MNDPVTISEIDQERFGVRTARAPAVTEDCLPQVLRFCHQNNVDLLIARCSVADLRTARLCEDLGFRIMDTLLYYAKRLRECDLPGEETSAEVRPMRTEEKDLIEGIARTAFADYPSHYYADPRLDRERCLEVYPSWAVRCSEMHDDNHQVLVALTRSQIAGFGALRMNSGEEAEGILFAVAPDFRGQGVFRELMVHSMRWGLRRGATRMLYSTQLQNERVHRPLAQMGFSIQRGAYTFHKWFV